MWSQWILMTWESALLRLLRDVCSHCSEDHRICITSFLINNIFFLDKVRVHQENLDLILGLIEHTCIRRELQLFDQCCFQIKSQNMLSDSHFLYILSPIFNFCCCFIEFLSPYMIISIISTWNFTWSAITRALWSGSVS